MNPANSTSAGVSLNFDAQALHNQDEAEYEREEQLRERELRDLLTQAFDDDLSDEEEGSIASTGATSNDESDHPDRQHVIQNDAMGWGAPGMAGPGHLYPMTAHTSTPAHPHVPPLSTPGPTPYSAQPLPTGHTYPGGGGREYLQYPTQDLERPSHPHEWDPHAQYYQGHPQQQAAHPLTTDPGLAYPQPEHYVETEYGHREEAEGGPDGLPPHPVFGNALQHPDPQQQHYFAQPMAQLTGPPQEAPYNGPPHQPDVHPYFAPTHDYPAGPQSHPTHSPRRPQLQPAGSREDLLAAPTTPDYPRPYLPYGGEASGEGADLEGYKVKYFGSTSADKPEQDHRQGPAGAAVTQPALLLPDHGGKDVNTPQHDFLNQDGASDGRQLGQLQILYSARGQKIEELTQELQALRDDSDREIRILKHKLALTQDERDGLEESLKQSQTLVTDTHRKEAEVQGKANALEAQVAALQQSKEELVKKLQTAESTIESLNAQLCELESSESLARSRDQHDNIVTGLQHKYEGEIFDLKQRLDKANGENDTKSQEIENLKKKVESLFKAAEEGQIERADTINRLTRTVEDSQKQCQQLLEAGTGQELSKVKVQLQEVIAGKSIAEDMNSALAEELQDLKEQVMMYESASQFGVMPLGSSTSSTPHPGGATVTAVSADDSYLQLGIKTKTDVGDSASGESTPRADMADGSSSSLNTEQTLHGLKKELERCLTMYRAKRQQVVSLQEELRATRHSLEEVGSRLEEAQRGAEDSARRLAEYEAEVGPLGGGGLGQESVQERRLQRQVDSLSRDKRMLDEEVKELMARIEEIAENEDKVKEANRELSHQMSEMVREYDEDKRHALELCEATLMEHHERVKAQLEADLRDELGQDSEKITREYVQQIEELRQELDSAQSELDEVKDMYISACQAKDQIRESTDQLWLEKMETKLTEVKEALTKDKEEELNKFKDTWASNNEAVLSAAKDKWLHEQEGDVNLQVEEQVAARKADWLREHAAAKDTAVAAALASAETKWKEKWDSELQNTLTDKLREAKETWTQEKEEEFSVQLALRVQDAGRPSSPVSPPALNEAGLTQQLEEARLTWYSTELPKALEEAKQAWRETELLTALEEAKLSWRETELLDALQHAKQSWRETELTTAVKEAREEARAAAAQTNPEIDTSKDLKTAVAGMLSEAKAQWLEEQRQEVEATVARVRQIAQEEADRRVEEATQQMKQEVSELHVANVGLAAEERADLLAAKDAERREAVVSAQDQCERDYREFLAEHQDTLNKALRTARDQFALEKAEIERKHGEELKGLREREAKASQLELQYNKEKAELEQKWQISMDEVTKKHAEEKDAMMRNHRDNLLKALEEARSRWQQKYEEALEENNIAVLEEKEAAWAEEKANLQTEIDIIKAEAAEHQDSLAKLRNEMDASHKREISQLVASHQAEHAASTANLRQQLDARSAEMERLSGEVRECVAGLEEAQRVAAEEAQELRAAIGQRDAEIARLKAELTASEERGESCETINKDVIRKLEGMQKQADRLERDRQEVEGQKEQLTASFQDRYAELIEQLQRADRKLKAAEVNTQKQIALVQESLEREHTVAMEKMKAKMVELRSNHIVAVDNLRKQHNAEKNEWRQYMAERERDMCNTPTQTEGQAIEAEALSEMGSHYLKTVTKMRSEVLRHVNDSNNRAAETVREQIVRERQTTARRLRRYYMKCLNHLLDAEGQHMTREEKLAYMEQALEYIPSRDTSQMTSASSAPRSTATTPDDLTMTTTATTSTNNTPKSNASHSRVDYHSPIRGRDKGSRVKDVVDSSLQTRVKTLVENYKSKDAPDQSGDRRDEVSPYSREHVSRGPQRRAGGGAGTQSLDRQVTQKRSSRMEVPRLDLSQVHGNSLEGHTPHNGRTNGAHPTSPTRRHCPASLSHSSWESEASSGDNAHHNGYYTTPESRTKEQSPSSGQSSRKSHSSRSSVTPGSSHKYNLSSKSAEHFSIEKPRSSRSKTKHPDSTYDLDMEVPSVHKSQSATCLEHSTPRGQYLPDSEPRKYYDVSFGTFREAQLRPVRDAACGSTTPLTKVNSEIYLLTPMGLQSGLHGSMSMGDVRDLDETDQSLTESKPMCRSDEGLLNCDSEAAGRGYGSKNRHAPQAPTPQKSTSMPNVARPERWAGTTTNGRTETNLYHYSDRGRQYVGEEDSGESTLSDSVNHQSAGTTRSGHQSSGSYSGSSSKHYGTKPYRSIYGNGLSGKKDQHHVVFKNVETNCEDEASDNESVKSFLSTSSVSDFRTALKTKQSRAERGASSREDPMSQGVPSHSAKKPVKVMPPSEQLQSMLAQVPDNVHRPVAMVTRHTQMPSPRPVYKQPRHYPK